MTRNVIRTVIVDLPANAAYAIWSNFEKYPEFLPHVEQVNVAGRQMKWKTHKDEQTLEWEAEILELTPPVRIAWVNHRHGYPQHVVITTRHLGPKKTEVTLGAQYEIAPGQTDRHAQDIDGHLQRFKAYAEGRSPGRAQSNDSQQADSPESRYL